MSGPTAWERRLRRKARSKKGETPLRLLRRMEIFQWWDPENIAAEQFKVLGKLLPFARKTIPHYGETLKGVESLKTPALAAGAWEQVPVLTRAAVNAAGENLMSRAVPKKHGGLDPIYTSGTTGRPVRVVRTDLALDYWTAFTVRDHLWHDRDLSKVLAVIRSSVKGFAPYPDGALHASWGASNRLFGTGPSVSLNVNTAIPDMAEWLVRTGPSYVMTLPNIVKRLAPYCRDNGIRVPNLREVQVHGEVCSDFIREAAGEAWGVPVTDMYTSREIGYMALQCPDHPHYHVQAEGVLLEVLDDADKPCGPGQVGRVVVTTLRNYAMPLIRYEIGDRAEVGEACPCGRGLPVLKRIIGREQDVLILPTGEQRWTLLGAPDVRDLMALAPIRQYQFAHVESDLIEVRLGMDRDLDETERTEITSFVQKKFGYPFRVRFHCADELPRTPAGKFRDFVREISDDPQAASG